MCVSADSFEAAKKKLFIHVFRKSVQFYIPKGRVRWSISVLTQSLLQLIVSQHTGTIAIVQFNH